MEISLSLTVCTWVQARDNRDPFPGSSNLKKILKRARPSVTGLSNPVDRPNIDFQDIGEKSVYFKAQRISRRRQLIGWISKFRFREAAGAQEAAMNGGLRAAERG